MIKLLLVPTLLLVSAAYAQLEEDKPPYSNGVLSFIEDLPEPGGDPRRLTPFVEVIDTDALRPCLEEGFNAADCRTFEYSIPFLPLQAATNTEKAIVDALYRYETRSRHRTDVETGHVPALAACATGLGALDIRHFMLKGELFYPAADFCDGLEAALIPNCTLECDVPLAFCPNAPGGCASCVLRAVAAAKAHAVETYYPQYLSDVAAALAENMALALPWASPLASTGGSLIAPIMGFDLPFTDLINMAKTAADSDPRAISYFFQTSAYSHTCQAVVPPQVLDVLRPLPGDVFDPQAPGLKPLEKYKRTLADREDAGDTYVRFDYWWNGRDGIYPRYTRAGAGVLGGGGEDAVLAVGPPLLHACMGYATFFGVSQEFTAYARLPGFVRRATCLSALPPFVAPTLTAPPLPQTVEGLFFHTDWNAVPEGMDIPGVEGTPRY